MKHDVYISYSMDNSGKAYELSGKLSLLHISYHLDCVESGFGLNGYTRGVIDDCRVYVALVGAKYSEVEYAHATLRYAIEQGKSVLVCPIGTASLCDELAEHTRVDEQDFCDKIERLLRSEVSACGESEKAKAEALGTVIQLLMENAIKNEASSEVEAVQIPTSSIGEARPDPWTKEEPQLQNERAERWKKVHLVFIKIARTIRIILYLCVIIPAAMLAYEEFRPKTRKVLAERHYENISKADKKEGARLNKLGSDYYYGRNGLKRNKEKAIELYEQAAELGNVEAMYNYAAGCKIMCKGVEKDNSKSLSYASLWAFRATRAGHPMGFELLSSFAEMNLAEAQNRLGICYAEGYGVSRDRKQAIYWYELAASNGSAYAKNNLAYYYQYGVKKKQDKQKAYDLYMEAAKAGVEGALESAERVFRE